MIRDSLVVLRQSIEGWVGTHQLAYKAPWWRRLGQDPEIPLHGSWEARYFCLQGIIGLCQHLWGTAVWHKRAACCAWHGGLQNMLELSCRMRMRIFLCVT